MGVVIKYPFFGLVFVGQQTAVESRVDIFGDAIAGEKASRRLHKFAIEVLSKRAWEEALLFGNEGGVGIGRVVNGGFDAMPVEGFVVPDGVEEAGLTAGCPDEPEAAVGTGEDAGDVAENLVVDEGGFIDDDDVGGVADAGTLVVSDGEDAGLVGEFEGVAFAVGAAAGDFDGGGVGGDFFDDDAGVIFGIGEDEDFGFGVIQGVMEGFDGDDGGLAPLAGATEDEAMGVVVEDFGLLGFGVEKEDGFGPGGGA